MQGAGPCITTIIPTYRRPHLLRRAVRSVLSQTYPHFQVAIFDNASGDETAAIIAELARDDPRVRYHCHPTNIGMVANFLYGVEHVETPFFSMLSDDDYFLPTLFETAMKGFEQHPDAVGSAGGTIVVTKNGAITYSSSATGYVIPPGGYLESLAGTYPHISGYIFRTEFIQRMGLLDPSIYYWDVDYLLKVHAKFPYVLAKEPGLVVVEHEFQSTKNVEVSRALHGYHAIQQNVHDDQAVPLALRTRVQVRLKTLFGGQFLYIVGAASMIEGDFDRAQQVAEALRAEFGRPLSAAALHLLATISRHSHLMHRLAKGLLLLMRNLVLRYRAVKYRAVREQIGQHLPPLYSP